MDERVKVAAIVPAYNEEQTIADVVRVLYASSLVDEVIVVSDGSSDRTHERAQAAGARAIQLPKKGGKGEAMMHGVALTDAPILLFCDADLIGLTALHVEALLFPVLAGDRMMNVGLRDKGLLTALTAHLPLIGGERAMSRQVFEGTPPKFLRGFAVESALNYFCRSRHLPYGAVFLGGLTMRRKYEKVGIARAAWQYVRMIAQVMYAMVAVRVARCFRKF